MILTDELFQKGLRGKNGITRRQSLELGESYPLKKGWRKRIVGKEYTEAQYENFLRFREEKNRDKKTPAPVVVLTEKQLAKAARRKARKERRLLIKQGIIPPPVKKRKIPKKVEYFSYMKSKAWRERSKKCITEAGFQCEVCDGIEGGLAAHHYNYLNLGNETRLDLFCLCSPCHADYHLAFPARLLPQDKDSSRPSRLYHLTLEIARFRARPTVKL